MSKNFIVVTIFILVLSVIITGCIDDEDKNTKETKSDFEKFIGTWRSSKRRGDSIFRADGTGNDGDANFTWEILDGKLRTYGDNLSETHSYLFSNGDNTLTIFFEDGSLVFERI